MKSQHHLLHWINNGRFSGWAFSVEWPFLLWDADSYFCDVFPIILWEVGQNLKDLEPKKNQTQSCLTATWSMETCLVYLRKLHLLSALVIDTKMQPTLHDSDYTWPPPPPLSKPRKPCCFWTLKPTFSETFVWTEAGFSTETETHACHELTQKGLEETWSNKLWVPPQEQTSLGLLMQTNGG